jgi:hypothetical protein
MTDSDSCLPRKKTSDNCRPYHVVLRKEHVLCDLEGVVVAGPESNTSENLHLVDSASSCHEIDLFEIELLISSNPANLSDKDVLQWECEGKCYSFTENRADHRQPHIVELVLEVPSY